MKIEKLKYYGGMLALALALASAPVNTLEVRAEDEVLYEDTEDDYTLEDITEEEQANREAEEEAARKAQEEAERKAAEEEAARKAAEEAAAAAGNPLENTKIDEEDQKYNTGRDEIPDTVLTEWERKHPGDNPPGDTPPGDTPPGDTPPGDTPQDTPSNVPKTGAGAVGLILAGAATGIYLGNRNILKYKEAKLSGLKVVDSKKKFKKASKGLTK